MLSQIWNFSICHLWLLSMNTKPYWCLAMKLRKIEQSKLKEACTCYSFPQHLQGHWIIIFFNQLKNPHFTILTHRWNLFSLFIYNLVLIFWLLEKFSLKQAQSTVFRQERSKMLIGRHFILESLPPKYRGKTKSPTKKEKKKRLSHRWTEIPKAVKKHPLNNSEAISLALCS